MSANFNFNKVILGGRLTADPELKTTPSGISVSSFTVAVNRRRAKEGEEIKADFFNVTAWRGTAEFVTRYFHKGSSICVVGGLQNRSWVDNEGQKHYATEIIADEVYFVDSKSVADSGNMEYSQPTTPVMPATSYMPDAYKGAATFEEIKDDEELPF